MSHSIESALSSSFPVLYVHDSFASMIEYRTALGTVHRPTSTHGAGPETVNAPLTGRENRTEPR